MNEQAHPESSNAVVAIDGPAASGKSSVARLVARITGFAYVNSGAMYRAATWWVLENGVDPEDEGADIDLIDRASIESGLTGDGHSTITIDGADPSAKLSDEAVAKAVSRVARIPFVRDVLVAIQRAYAEIGNLVMEGRDIGSVVFPDTRYKFYIDADEEVRARRRRLEGHEDSISQRDKEDSSRPTSPLVIPEDAHVIDSSHLTLEGVAGEVIGRLRLMGLEVEL